MAYRIGNEKFWKDAAWGKTINDLKFRASYGKMGDDNIEAFLFFDGYNAYNGSYVMEDNKVTIGFAPGKCHLLLYHGSKPHFSMLELTLAFSTVKLQDLSTTLSEKEMDCRPRKMTSYCQVKLALTCLCII